MRILTQSGTELVSVDNFLINDKAEIIGYSVMDPEHCFVLGKYKDLDEAKFILNELANGSDFRSGYRMPDSAAQFIKIDDLNLSIRSKNILHAAGFEFLGDILNNKDNLSEIPKIGRKTLKEIEEAIQNYVQ